MTEKRDKKGQKVKKILVNGVLWKKCCNFGS